MAHGRLPFDLAQDRPVGQFSLADANSLEGTQVNQDVSEGVLVGHSAAIAQLGPFDAQFGGLAIDPFGGGALPVDLLEGIALPVKLVAQAGPDGGGHGVTQPPSAQFLWLTGQV